MTDSNHQSHERALCGLVPLAEVMICILSIVLIFLTAAAQEVQSNLQTLAVQLASVVRGAPEPATTEPAVTEQDRTVMVLIDRSGGVGVDGQLAQKRSDIIAMVRHALDARQAETGAKSPTVLVAVGEGVSAQDLLQMLSDFKEAGLAVDVVSRSVLEAR